MSAPLSNNVVYNTFEQTYHITWKANQTVYTLHHTIYVSLTYIYIIQLPTYSYNWAKP